MSRRVALALALLAAASTPAAGQQVRAPAMSGPELLAALRGGGWIIYFRHADTDHQQKDARELAQRPRKSE